MESAKLRLIILGALRGLIKPGYENGVNSVVREELLLRALGRELDGHALIHRGVLEGSVISIVDDTHRTSTYQRAIGYIMQGSAVQKLFPDKRIRDIFVPPESREEAAQMGTLLKILKRTDYFDKMEELLSE